MGEAAEAILAYEMRGMFEPRRPRPLNQADCKKQFEALLCEFIVSTTLIDANTPWSDTEPKWWVKMQDIENLARKIKQGLK